MPTPTYVAIAKTVLTSTQTTITFSSIPSTYTDIVLLYTSRDNRAVNNQNPFSLTINSDTATNYSQTNLYGYQGPAVYSDRLSSQTTFTAYTSNTLNNTSNTFTNGELYFSNYTSTGNKPISLSCVMEQNVDGTGLFMPIVSSLLYRGTSAISSFTLTPQNSASFVSGSRFDLYGIKNS